MALPPHLPTPPGFSDEFVANRLDEALSGTSASRPRLHGLSGLPGTGKSTLAQQMSGLAKGRGLAVVVVSLDDFYLGRRERQAWARRVHPLLATRGPPGSHDLALAEATLAGLCRGEAVRLPRFDKLSDRRLPPSRWRRHQGRPDLVLFEGWCLGVPPEAPTALATAINALERDEDPRGIWRRHCNDALAHYAPLWSRLDALTFLQPPGYEVVPGWRWQQEQALSARRPGRPAMDRDQVGRFMQHFERVARQALRTLPAIADHVVALDAARRPRAG